MALNEENIFRTYVHFPESEEELEAMRLRFFLKHNFPGIVGVVDGTHVAIIRPMENEETIPFTECTAGYPLRPWIVTPLNDVQPGTPEERFQNAFLSIRASVERCNGKIKNMWRCLLRHRVLHYSPQMAGHIRNACVVLHNIATDHNIEEPDINEVADVDFGMYEPDRDELLNDPIRNINPELAAGRLLRQTIINNHFA